jgi:hypothetical protein
MNAPAANTPADLSGDGLVGFVDFQILELNYGHSLPAAPVFAAQALAPARAVAQKPPRLVIRSTFATRRLFT